MINIAALVQLKAFARQDGVFVALLWTASFLAVVLAPTSSWGSLLAMGTPFLVGYLLMRFRNGVLDGVISFRRAWLPPFFRQRFAEHAPRQWHESSGTRI